MYLGKAETLPGCPEHNDLSKKCHSYRKTHRKMELALLANAVISHSSIIQALCNNIGNIHILYVMICVKYCKFCV